ncbi:unnamed protein product [Chrysoparadoxa australica]
MIVILWSVPRSVSSAFEKAMIQRSDSVCFHEPFARPFYYGIDRLGLRFEYEPIDQNTSFAKVAAKIQSDQPGKSLMFSKDMAYYLYDESMQLTKNPAVQALLRDVVNTFIIRNPAKSIPSLYKGNIDTKFGDFVASECGFRQQLALFKHVTEELGQKAIVIDADDLLCDPEGMMRQYCAAVEIPFEHSMLSWEAGKVKEFQGFDGWHTETEKSTGFRRKEAPEPDLSQLPAPVREAIDDATPSYEYMHKVRLRAQAPKEPISEMNADVDVGTLSNEA